MRNLAFFALVILGCGVSTVLSGPISVVTADEEPREMPDELIIDDEDDSTTRTLERLASAATCLVAGVEYTHGQQIYRKDPCEFCLCLDGEMFCWWQDCPPVADGPCKDRRPFSPCANGGNQVQVQPVTQAAVPTSTPRGPSSRAPETSATAETESWSTENSSSEATTLAELSSRPREESTTAVVATTAASLCVVMGKEYKIGEMLPHATGNCLECICGDGARVTCSPHLCAPPGDDAADYRPPGPRPELPDSF